MESKYEEMARQMRADGASEKMIARFVADEMEEDPGAHPQAAARQRVLPQLRHDGVRARLHAAHAPRLRAHRGPVRGMRDRGRKAV